MTDNITVYEAKFTVYSTYEALLTIIYHLQTNPTITKEDLRILIRSKDDLQKVLSNKWDLGKV